MVWLLCSKIDKKWQKKTALWWAVSEDSGRLFFRYVQISLPPKALENQK
jgi:hypothetical protein